LCPRIASGEYNLALLNPELAKEWHPDNGLLPEQVTPFSRMKVKWRCEKGHEWLARVCKRSGGNNCPVCFFNSKPGYGQKLPVTHPHLAAQWNYEKNKSLLPTMVTFSSQKKVWWRCEKGHEWVKSINKRSQGRGCPLCAIKPLSADYCLTRLKPEVAIEWHPEKNGSLIPWDVTPWSRKRVWWRCRKGHEWQARVDNRFYGSRCPVCHGNMVTEQNCLEAQYSELAAQWHPEKNGALTPGDIRPFSRRRVWWKCRWGHEWEARIDKRSIGRGCPECRKRLITRSSFVLKPSFK